METLVVFAQHRDQFISRNHGSNIGSPSSDFREISCRTFQSGSGILPTPVKATSSPYEQNLKQLPKTSSVPIPISVKHVDRSVNENMNEFFYSELWAGPAYSNSPPPSSLPIPKFSIKPKRTVSLDLPSGSASGVDLLSLLSKSAPTSPTGDLQKCTQMEFFNTGDDSATKTLRRILNLDY